MSGTVTGGFDGSEDPPHDGNGVFLTTSGAFSGQGFTAVFQVNDALGLATSSPVYSNEIAAGSPGVLSRSAT